MKCQYEFIPIIEWPNIEGVMKEYRNDRIARNLLLQAMGMGADGFREYE